MNRYNPYVELPPREVLEAAALVEHYYKSNGIDRWKLMGLQSRDNWTCECGKRRKA